MVRRRNRGGVGRVSAISKECRIVNGGGDGGFVNHCEQVLDDQNKMVMAASKIAVVSGSDQTVTSVNHRDYPLAPNKLNHKLKEEYRKSVALLNEKILKLTNEVDNLKQKLAVTEKNLDVLPFTQVSSTCSSGIGNLSLADRQDEQEQQGIKFKKRRISQAATKQPNPDPLESNQIKPFVIQLERMSPVANQYVAKSVAREKNLDVLPFTRVSSTCSSGVGNLGLAEIQDQQEQQDIKLKRQRIRRAAIKQPNPDPLESNQTKQRRTSNAQAKSAKIRKMQELSSITADDAYYTCLGNYDPTKDEPVSKNTKSNLEIPSWRVIEYSGSHSVEGTEIMSDRIFEKKHLKHEKKEQICKKRDLRRLKELIRVKNLKQGRNKHHSQKSNNKEELTTLLPCPLNIKAIEITDELPVSAIFIT